VRRACSAAAATRPRCVDIFRSMASTGGSARSTELAVGGHSTYVATWAAFVIDVTARRIIG
jgi:hypothetical protein